ncbi:MAG TPA: hypothetical protein VGE09_11150 [Pseudoxanthomonas sp.]
MIALPLGLVTAGKAVWGFLRAIPWQAWVVAAVLFVGWRYGEHRYDAGVAEENARWVDAQAKADRDAKAATAKRDKAADGVNTATTERAHQATVETRTETAAAVERVRYVTRTIEVPAGCPTALPDVVRDEGRAAVESARAARN